MKHKWRWSATGIPGHGTCKLCGLNVHHDLGGSRGGYRRVYWLAAMNIWTPVAPECCPPKEGQP